MEKLKTDITMDCGLSKGDVGAVILIQSDFRYKDLIFEAMEKGNIKRLNSFIKMGKLQIITPKE